MVIPVILSGGSGTRLWPISRQLFPKQLMPMTGGQYTLFQGTLDRLKDIPDIARPVVICNNEHRFIIASQMQELNLKPYNIILEPVGRNTAPAITVAALSVLEKDPLLLVIPADHHITDNFALCKSVEAALPLAASGKLVTFGVVPTYPETGYGYIKTGSQEGGTGYKIEKFVEKPDLSTATNYLSSGDYLWNSGMFLFKASAFLNELKKHSPEIFDKCETAFSHCIQDLDFTRLDDKYFPLCESQSVDIAVFEKTEKGYVVPLSCGWSDIGSWSALHAVREKDLNGNVVVGDTVLNGVKNSYFHSTGRLIAGLNLSNIAIIETKDVVLVSPLDSVQDVKKIVSQLEEEGREVTKAHCKIFRPWGCYEGIDLGQRYQVKRITVYPGQQLSLQKHFHRSEHWIVVNGTAKITKGDEEILLTEDQSTYIPLGEVHRLENPGKLNLELIEVQTGSYLGEDDIVRLSDLYGRDNYVLNK